MYPAVECAASLPVAAAEYARFRPLAAELRIHPQLVAAESGIATLRRVDMQVALVGIILSHRRLLGALVGTGAALLRIAVQLARLD